MLRRFRPMRASVKRSTGITGYPVVPNARAVLASLYEKTLEELKTLPEEAGYRTHTAAFTSWRLSVVQREESVPAIEAEIECGQIEELIEQAEEELGVLAMMRDKNLCLPEEGEPVPEIFIRTHENLTEEAPEEEAPKEASK